MPFFPKLAVVIPVYNHAERIRFSVLSVVEQLTDECELIVVNDGSTDATADTLERLLVETGQKFRLFHKANGGAASARNFGIQHSQAEYFLFLDADDVLHEKALVNVTRCLAENPEVDTIIGGVISVWEKEGKRKESLPDEMPSQVYARVKSYLIDKKISLSNGATVFSRKVFDNGWFPEHFRNAEDIPVFVQALGCGKCKVLKYPLVYVYKSSVSLRHNVDYDRQVGMRLVDEIFETGRISSELYSLKKPFVSQRALSLFRGYYLAGLYSEARRMYHLAVRNSWKSIFKLSYTKKYLRALFK